MLGMTRRLTDVLAKSPDGKIYRIERFVGDSNASDSPGNTPLKPTFDCTCRTSSGDQVTWLGGQDYRLVKTGTLLTALDRRQG